MQQLLIQLSDSAADLLLDKCQQQVRTPNQIVGRALRLLELYETAPLVGQQVVIAVRRHFPRSQPSAAGDRNRRHMKGFK